MSRTVKRWVAECDVFAMKEPCPFNDRVNPQLHVNAQAAVRESITHAIAAGHVGAREVTVERTYKLEREEIVS